MFESASVYIDFFNGTGINISNFVSTYNEEVRSLLSEQSICEKPDSLIYNLQISLVQNMQISKGKQI